MTNTIDELQFHSDLVTILLEPLILDVLSINISAAYGDHGAGGITTHRGLIHATKN